MFIVNVLPTVRSSVTGLDSGHQQLLCCQTESQSDKCFFVIIRHTTKEPAHRPVPYKQDTQSPQCTKDQQATQFKKTLSTFTTVQTFFL